MPIQLRHQTQQSVSPSALSHGVGLPVSDGGAGAISKALGQVAGAASQIGSASKRRAAEAKREKEKADKQAAADATTRYRTEVRKVAYELKDAAKRGDEAQIAAAQEKLDVLGKAPLGAFYSATKDGAKIPEDVLASAQLSAQEFFTAESGSAALTINLDRKQKQVQNHSVKLAGERIWQGMDAKFNKVLEVMATNNSEAIDAAVNSFHEEFVQNKIDGNSYLNFEEGDVRIEDDGVSLLNERAQSRGSMLYRQLHTKNLNRQTKAIQMAQVEGSAKMTRDIVSRSTESFIPVADAEAAFRRMVDGFNNETVAGYQDTIQVDFADQADSVVDAFIRSTKFSEAPETLPEQVKELQKLLGDEQIQAAIGTRKAGTLIDRLSKSFKQVKEKPDYTALLNTARSTVDDLLSGSVAPANTDTYPQYGAIRQSIGSALRDPNTPKDVWNRFNSMDHALDIRTKFDYNDQGTRRKVHEWFTKNPDAKGKVVLTSGALEKLGVDVSRLSDTERTDLGNYFKRFSKEVNDVTKEFGDFEGKLLLSGSIGLNYDVSKVAKKFPEVVEKAQAALSAGDPATVKKLGDSLSSDLWRVGQDEYPLISTLTEYVGEEGRSPQEISAAVSLITAVYGPKRMANFIGDHSAPESPVHGKELANLMSVQSVADPKAQVAAASWVAKGGDPASYLTKPQLKAYEDAQSHLQARIKGSVDYSGRRVVDPDDPIGSLRPIPTALAKVTQGLISEDNASVAQFYETMYNGILVQEIADMEPSDAANPVKVVERAEAVMHSIFSFTTLQNGTMVIGQTNNIPKKWLKDGISTEDGVQFAWYKAVHTAEKEIGVVKQFRNIHAENPNDDLELAEYKAKMREIESDEDFLESIINEDIVRPDGSVGPVIRWGLPSGDKQERTLLMYNPNNTVGASKWEPLVRSNGKAYTVSDVSLYSGITKDEVDMYHRPHWTRIKKNVQQAFFGPVEKSPEVDRTHYRGGEEFRKQQKTFSEQFAPVKDWVDSWINTPLFGDDTAK